jgi:hypothetical protein
VIYRHYLPWLLGAGRDRFPETAALPPEAPLPRRFGAQRWLKIGRDEGLAAMLHRMGKEVQWRLQSDV